KSEAHAKEHERLGQEMSAHKRAKEALRATQERLQLMSDALPIMVFYCDKNLQCQHHNAAFRTWLRLNADQIIGRQLKELLGESAFEGIASYVKEALAGVKVHLEWSHKFFFGALSHIEGDLIPHSSPFGQIIGFFGVLTDITARKQLDFTIVKQAVQADPVAHKAPAAEISGQAFYINAISEQLTGWNDAAARLTEILEKDELRLYHQLILPLKPNQGYPPIHEILIRLCEEEDSMTPPGAFIPIIEHFNLMPAVDRWVVSHVIDWYIRKHPDADTKLNDLYSINLSGQSVSDSGFAEHVRKQIESRGFPAQMLCFEISEEEAVARIDDTSRFIATLKPLGCRFLLDGFGSMKVSFECLNRLPVDFLKIDGSVVLNILRDTVALGKVKAIQQVCSMVGIRTIVEFVENDEILNRAKELGMDYAQGFGIDRPKLLE
ncbi:MAG: EAL domain-containing protein, partial [Gammaproteobacteria bacterium]